MIVQDNTDRFPAVDLARLTIPTMPPPPKDLRGYIYIVLDSAFPEHFKIGKTADMQKRLAAYNTDKPFKTTRVYCISSLFTDVHTVETKILNVLYSNTKPTTFSKEWFEIEYLDFAKDIIEEAEGRFDLETPTTP